MNQEVKLILGLCCINTYLQSTYKVRSRTLIRSKYTKEEAIKRATENLKDILLILEENVKQNIKSFRLSSELLPRFTDEQVESYDIDQFQPLFEEIGSKAIINNIRLTFHPDQFVVLSSDNEKIVSNSIKEIEYHCEMLERMGVNTSLGVCNIHVGGIYEPKICKTDDRYNIRKGCKKQVFERWVKNYNRLSDRAKGYLTIENDEKMYNLNDCLELSEMCTNDNFVLPVVYDTHHEECYIRNHPNDIHIPVEQNIERLLKSWKDKYPLAHISNQDVGKRIGAHSMYITRVPDILYLYASKCPENKLWVDVEAKGKEEAIFEMKKIFKNMY